MMYRMKQMPLIKASPNSNSGWILRGRNAAYGAILLFVLSTAVAALTEHFNRPTSTALIYMLGVTVIGATSGLRNGLIAAVAASFIYNFFLSEPVFAFSAMSAGQIARIIAFNCCAVISGLFAGRQNDRARKAEEAQARLNMLSDRLQKVMLLPDLVTTMNGAELRSWLGRFEFLDAEGHRVGAPPDVAWTELAELQFDGPSFHSERHGATLYRLEQAGHDIGSVIFGDTEASFEGRFNDMEAVVALVAMTVERCLLLQQLSQTEAVRRSEELKTALLSSLSHDMRTPLSAIAASASSLRTLSDDLDPGVRLKLLQTIQEQCERLDRYTANLLDLGRLQAGIDPDKLEDVDIVEILGSVLRSARAQSGQRNIRKSFDSPAAIVRGNPVMAEQIFGNLLENAIRYSPDDSAIDLNLFVRADHVHVEIVDQGCGIPKNELPLLFDRFYRSSRTKHLEGQGLGLSIAKGFVKLFHGSIAIDSPHANGTGTQVIVRLPLSFQAGQTSHG